MSQSEIDGPIKEVFIAQTRSKLRKVQTDEEISDFESYEKLKGLFVHFQEEKTLQLKEIGPSRLQ